MAKLADLPGSRQALEDFRVPSAFVPAGVVALPLAELTAGVLLVVAPTARSGAALAALLLMAFIIGISSALRRGQAPACHCFGQISSQPAGAETLTRNVVL